MIHPVPKPPVRDPKPRKQLRAKKRIQTKTPMKKRNVARLAKRQSDYDKYMQSPEWKSKRLACLALAKWTCQSCGWDRVTSCFIGDAMDDRKLVAHHLSYRHWKDERQDELQCLCKPCHDRIEAMSAIRPRFKRAS